MPEINVSDQIELIRVKTRRDIMFAIMVIFAVLSLAFMWSVHGDWSPEHMTLLALIFGYAAGVLTMGAAFFYGSKEKE